MGILTAIIVSPYNCSLNIYTDSASCINVFATLLNSPIISPRQKLKQTNFLVWDLIFFLIKEKHLLITLRKVKGHGDDDNNNIANTLAKAGAHIKDPIIVNHKFFYQQILGIVSWNNKHVIDHNVRKWSQNVIQPLIFNSMVNNTSLTPIKIQIIDGDIDWTFTKEWLNHNPTDAPCSAKLSKRQGARKIACIECKNMKDNNEHVGLCPAHIRHILIEQRKTLLILIKEHVNEKDHALEETINSSRLFDVNFVGSLPSDHLLPINSSFDSIVMCALIFFFPGWHVSSGDDLGSDPFLIYLQGQETSPP
ncbi:hypothetical protein RhiirC2_719193 [Rhizophagus irregularis]|uniref:RNase H type-1 domain-containing protein n=1 Tax=Rhizophagus irregularis TaxID=588596 RepID=A0A2N1MFA3_9GLOM|nr:hypothetical protein RhiirC2_719193 [Rhizophagus irregularis]